MNRLTKARITRQLKHKQPLHVFPYFVLCGGGGGGLFEGEYRDFTAVKDKRTNCRHGKIRGAA